MTEYTSVARARITQAPAAVTQAELPGLPPKRTRLGGKPLRKALAEDVISIRQCEIEMRHILQRLKQAGATKAVHQLRIAVRSVDGAGRHAHRALTTKEMARYLAWVQTNQLPAPEVETPKEEEN